MRGRIDYICNHNFISVGPFTMRQRWADMHLEGVMQTERISDAEYEVMNCLWQASPLTASDIAHMVPGERQWSLQTVKTLLSRLVTKNVVSHAVDGRRYLYSPLISRSAYITNESKRFVDRMFSGRAAPLFAHLAEREAFSEEDISDIEKLLRKMKK